MQVVPKLPQVARIDVISLEYRQSKFIVDVAHARNHIQCSYLSIGTTNRW